MKKDTNLKGAIMKKYSILLFIIFISLSACGYPPTHDNNISGGSGAIPIITEPISIPPLPSRLTVNGEATPLNDTPLLTIGDALILSPLILPTDTFDTMQFTSIDAVAGMKVLHIVPSIDTPICSIQTRQLDNATSEFPDISFFTISADTPFAMKRFADTNSIHGMQLLSDYQSNTFTKNNHMFLPEYALSTRALIIVDAENTVVYLEYAQEITSEIDVVRAINFIRQNF